MAQIIYHIVSGTPNFTASILPAALPAQIHNSVGIYSFDDVPADVYVLSVIDANGCKRSFTVDLRVPDDCELEAVIIELDCTFEGVAIEITTTTTTTIIV
jgi:hypothetical protein